MNYVKSPISLTWNNHIKITWASRPKFKICTKIPTGEDIIQNYQLISYPKHPKIVVLDNDYFYARVRNINIEQGTHSPVLP